MEARRGELSDERGFTLVGLLIVIMILPLVVGAITVGLISVLSLHQSVETRTSGSGDAQVVLRGPR